MKLIYIKKKKLILAVIIIIIILFSFCLIFMGTSVLNDKKFNGNIEIIIKDSDLRVQKPIEMTISNNTKKMNVSWDFGEGNISYGKSIHYSYSVSDYYIITATVTIDNQIIISNKTIGIKNKDEIVEGEISRQVCIKPRMNWEAGMNNIIKPGISIPIINVVIDVPSATGNIGVKILISNPTSEDNYQEIIIYEETEYLFKESISYSDTLLPDDHSILQAPYLISASVILKEGSCSNFFISIEVIY